MAHPPVTADIAPALFYRDAPAALEWLARAFGLVNRFVMPGPEGTVAHAEMSFGNGVIMLGTAKPDKGWLSPLDLSGVHQTICLVVDDVDAHYARAQAAGAEITQEIADTDYGSRGYTARDPEGHVWTIANYRAGGYWAEPEA
jgi:uncharacterized glyoxalase superfamily protein PhnB